MSKPMTDEEYLRTSEWQTDCPYGLMRWFKRNAAGLYSRGPFERIEEAIEVQLAEDRARYNFVRERSEMHGGMLVTPELAEAIRNAGSR